MPTETRLLKYVLYAVGVRDPTDAANAKAVRCEDPILLCTTGADVVVTGILEATCKTTHPSPAILAAALMTAPASLPTQASYRIELSLILVVL